VRPRTILFDFEPPQFVELCRDPNGVRVDLLEVTGIRQRDVDELLADLERDLVACHAERPGWLRIVTWTDAAWLAEHEPEEYATVRSWISSGLADMQHPWRVPMVGPVGCAVLQGELPEAVAHLRVGDRRDLDYERLRPPERRAQRRG
jgi:hypothetical protein